MTAAAWLEDWGGRIRSLGEGLLTLEINTVEKASMSAQKMPDAPLALHAIIDVYSRFLGRQGYAPDAPLLRMAAERVALPPGTPPEVEARHADGLAAWHPTRDADAAGQVTNGPETFEALQWAAGALLRDMATLRDRAAIPRGAVIFESEVAGIAARIRANGRQLREAAILLARDHPGEAASERQASGRQKLFGVTEDEAVRALLNNPLPPLFVRPDVLVLIRKAWDIGVEVVLMQTAIQVDGDVVVRVSPQLDDARREFFQALHDRCTQTSLGQWRGLFELLRELVGDVGKTIWGLAR